MKTIKSTFCFIFFTILLVASCSKETSTTPTVEEPQQELPVLEFNTLTTPIDKSLEVKLLPVPILEWNVKNALEGEIIKYSVRLGTSENNLETIATDYTETDFQIDFLLDPETTYFWQIVLTNRDKGETLSPIYRFTSDTIKIEDPVIEQIVRDALLKPEGKFTREELESITSLPLDESIPFYDAMEPYDLPETLTGLEYCTNLHYVNFYGKGFQVPLSNIKALSNLKDITYLNLANNQITEVQSIGGLTELTYLHLGWNTGINDISYLTNLKKLKTLNLTYTYGLRDLTPLASLPQLDSLLMTTARYVEDATVIGELTNLKKLSFTSNDNISDFSFLENLTEMRDLSMYSNDSIADISFLTGMNKLTKLNISKNKITDITVLENLLDLEYLELNNLKIKDFSVLTKLTKLQEVWLHSYDIDETFISIQELQEALPNTVFKVNNKTYN